MFLSLAWCRPSIRLKMALASLLPHDVGMMTPSAQAPKSSVAESTGILRWVFLRGAKALTCEVRTCGKETYDVSVVPHWDVSSSVIETFRRPASALQRHAEISREFRQAGWILVREGTSQRPLAAA